MKEIKQKTITIELNEEEFMLLTAVMGYCDGNDYEEAMQQTFNTSYKDDLGFKIYNEMIDILDNHGVKIEN